MLWMPGGRKNPQTMLPAGFLEFFFGRNYMKLVKNPINSSSINCISPNKNA